MPPARQPQCTLRAGPPPTRWARAARRAAAALALAGTAAAASPAWAAAPGAESPAPVDNSALDAPLFFQLLIGEIELRSGRAGNAYEYMLDAARRTGDDGLFRRAVEIAMQARAGDQALTAVRAWRTARPASAEAMRFELQLLLALGRPGEAGEPLRALLAQAAEADRAGLIAAIPRLFERAADMPAAAAMVEQVLQPYLAQPGTRTAARTAMARMHAAAGARDKAVALAAAAHADDPAAVGPVLVAGELLDRQPGAEAIVTSYLARPDAVVEVRLAYVRALTARQRYKEAAAQLDIVTSTHGGLADAWLSLGALRLEMRESAAAETALLRYLALVDASPVPGAPAGPAGGAAGGGPTEPDESGDSADSAEADSRAEGQVQAWLMLAQAAEMRGDTAASERWLARIDDPQRALQVQSRRALLLVRQGQVEQARQLIRAVPEKEPGDARAKLQAEVQVLREARRWEDAWLLMADGLKRFGDDIELIYEKAMLAERIGRFDDMEALLRRIMTLEPNHYHAHNALGYSLADRNQRLPEARQLIVRALELAPGDPFITDSLGWVEYRLGNREESLRLLRQAYGARPDPEIAAHLGEVLWVSGRRDEARQVWQDAKRRDAANEVLRSTLARLQVDL